MSHPNLFLQKRIDFLALEHLSKRVASEAKDADKAAACRQAIETLAKELGVSPASKSDAYKYGSDATLSELILAGSEQVGSSSNKRPADEDFQSSAKFLKYVEKVKSKGVFSGMTEGSPQYLETMEKVKKAYLDRFEPQQPKLSREEAEKAAEALKQQGNEKLTNSDYEGALSCYNQAIDLCPDGPNTYIYLSNRAAVYTHMKEFDKAAADCSAAIALKPDFAKAYSRLANAQLSLGQTEEARKSAERALELDPTNGVALATIEKIRSSQQQQQQQATARGAGGRGRGMPQMPGGFPGGLPGMGAGGPGGMDLAGMMNNPMVQQMMQDPQMMQMAQEMAKDPNAMANMMNMFGLGGGGGGAGRGRGRQ